jgi:hypothetical protein
MLPGGDLGSKTTSGCDRRAQSVAFPQRSPPYSLARRPPCSGIYSDGCMFAFHSAVAADVVSSVWVFTSISGRWVMPSRSRGYSPSQIRCR